MSEYEKVQKLITEADELISKQVTAEDTEFGIWEYKVKKYIIEKFGDKSFEMNAFDDINFSLSIISSRTHDSEFVNACKEGISMAKGMLKIYLEDLDNNDHDITTNNKSIGRVLYDSVFIVHGHDNALKQSVARIIEKQNIKAIILSEQTNKGKTIIEKFEEYANIPGAICLFTKDDIATDKCKSKKIFRARQNVIFETGYFMGKIGRDKVIILSDSKIDMPSDLSGVLYTSNKNWEIVVLKELREIGYNIDMNKL